jgi:hypothetical protein
MYDCMALAGVIIALFIVLGEVIGKKKKAPQKGAKVNYNVMIDELGEWSGIDDFYNCEPIEVIILEGGFVVNETIDR